MTDAIVNEPDRVILRGELGEAVVMDVTWDETPNIKQYDELFDTDRTDYPVGGDYYQGLNLWRVITRKSDGRKFGFIYWDSPGNDGMEADYSSNGEDHGIVYEYDDDYEIIGGEEYVFLPVVPSSIPTFKFEDAS
ncbi:hypothetical protein [Mycobacterium sp. CnD-18-1]|uniref:hypothetical protein n=1 Tax=Mycobacterium sp. CnD-18-1 TaxID=2917744 RepID=UPI001EF2E8EC|nr:hypothetical protein [Mycobacterium sp. CnD-18-1]MCG7607160.1 hypothetical protein [Mycobacterium sp. CnD-18-1]